MSQRKRCRKCNHLSVPGLAKGQGLCGFHFDSVFFGVEWARKIRAYFSQEGD